MIAMAPGLYSQGNWQVIGEMPYPIFGGQAIVLDSLILIVGGTRTPPDQLVPLRATERIQAYDPKRHTWREMTPMNVPRYGFAADTSSKNGLLLCGGSWQDDQQTFTIEKWNYQGFGLGTTETVLQNAACNRVYFTGHTYRNRFYLFGGMSSPTSSVSGRFPEMIVFDMGTNSIIFNSDSVTRKHLLPYHHTSVRINNMVYIMGGVHAGITTSILSYDLDKLDTSELIFSKVGDLTTVRAGCHAVVTDDHICVIGGYTELAGPLSSVDLISRSTFVTLPGPEMHHPRREPMTVIYEDTIYVFGGWNETDSVVAVIERIAKDDLVPVSIVQPGIAEGSPDDFELGQNFPNPFNGTTIIPFRLSAAGKVRIEIFNILGERIAILYNGPLSAGTHKLSWNATDEQQLPVPSGTYFYQLTTHDQKRSGKMILMR